MSEPITVPVVVAMIVDPSKGVLLKWNEKWGVFTLPLTKWRNELPKESANDAALRAAAEATGCPVRIVPGREPQKTRDLLRSERDGTIKNYVYTLVLVEVHPHFANQPLPQGSIWVPRAGFIEKEYEPVSETVKALLPELQEWKWI